MLVYAEQKTYLETYNREDNMYLHGDKLDITLLCCDFMQIMHSSKARIKYELILIPDQNLIRDQIDP